MPFIANTTEVCGPSNGPIPAAIDAKAGAFTATITASCGPSSAGSALAATGAWISPSAACTTRPSRWIAARCAPRATTDTSAPPLNSRPARCPPIAPAP
jgi:hypothetical protein